MSLIPCPTCGVPLPAQVVTDMKINGEPEWCPRNPEAKPTDPLVYAIEQAQA